MQSLRKDKREESIFCIKLLKDIYYIYFFYQFYTVIHSLIFIPRKISKYFARLMLVYLRILLPLAGSSYSSLLPGLLCLASLLACLLLAVSLFLQFITVLWSLFQIYFHSFLSLVSLSLTPFSLMSSLIQYLQDHFDLLALLPSTYRSCIITN